MKAKAWMLAPLLVFILGIFANVAVSLRMCQASKSKEWPTADAEITKVSVKKDEGDSSKSDEDRWETRVEFKYTVEGKTYEGHRLDWRLVGHDSKLGAKKATRALAKGKKVRVRYDPSHPSNAVIKTGITSDLVMIFLGSTILMVVTAVLTFVFARKKE